MRASVTSMINHLSAHCRAKEHFLWTFLFTHNTLYNIQRKNGFFFFLVKFKRMNSKIVGRGLEKGREWDTDQQRKSLQIKIDELERIGTHWKQKDCFCVFIYFALYGVGRSLWWKVKDSGTQQWSMKTWTRFSKAVSVEEVLSGKFDE